jgi:putative endonuclease
MGGRPATICRRAPPPRILAQRSNGDWHQPRHGRACPGHPRLAYFRFMSGFVYIMTNRRDGVLYVGVTSDLIRRAYEHREGAVAGFTKRYGLKRLVYFELYDDIQTAIQREKTIKHWPRAWKVWLINGSNRDWADLADGLQ